MGQISSTSKGEISCLISSSFTSEAKTFSAKERIASSISARRRSRVQGHTRHLVPSHPNRQVPLAVSLMLRCHCLTTPTPPCCLEDSEQPPKVATSLLSLGHTQWAGNIPRYSQHTRKHKYNPHCKSSTKRPRKKSLQRPLTRACTGDERGRLAEPLQLWEAKDPLAPQGIQPG